MYISIVVKCHLRYSLKSNDGLHSTILTLNLPAMFGWIRLPEPRPNAR